jgi:hypothetical protein
MGNKAIVALCLSLFLGAGCTTAPVRQAIGRKYVSSLPPLEVEFAYAIGNVENNDNDKLITLYTTEVKPVWVEVDPILVPTHQPISYFSLENIAKNIGFKYLETIYFSDHQWVKVAHLNKRNFVMCGYLTRKDDWMIFIHNSEKLDAEGIRRYQNYQRTLTLTDADMAVINKMFENLDRAIAAIR